MKTGIASTSISESLSVHEDFITVLLMKNMPVETDRDTMMRSSNFFMNQQYMKSPPISGLRF